MSTPKPTPPLPLEVALRRLGVERQSGHCGEGNIERMARDAHNEAVDVVLSALFPKGGSGEGWPDLEDLMRTLERVADHVTTMKRECTRTGFEAFEAVAADCVPEFERIGMTNEGDGWGFDWPAAHPAPKDRGTRA